MGRQKINIKKRTLGYLYSEKKLSTYKLAKFFGCSFKTIINRLREYKIPRKSSSAARNRYVKKNIENNLALKAYIYGFRLGDLNVYKTSPNSETVVVRCSTTHREQLNLIKKLFSPYGKVSVSFSKKGVYCINCFLNNSFDFIFSKNEKSWKWVRSDKDTSINFIAGYTDAEGSFIVSNEKAIFKIDSYDLQILRWISDWLIQNNIAHKFRCICKKGEIKYVNHKWKSDLWRLSIADAHNLKKYLKLVIPYLKHGRRVKAAKRCFQNIKLRIKNGTI